MHEKQELFLSLSLALSVCVLYFADKFNFPLCSFLRLPVTHKHTYIAHASLTQEQLRRAHHQVMGCIERDDDGSRAEAWSEWRKADLENRLDPKALKRNELRTQAWADLRAGGQPMSTDASSTSNNTNNTNVPTLPPVDEGRTKAWSEIRQFHNSDVAKGSAGRRPSMPPERKEAWIEIRRLHNESEG